MVFVVLKTTEFLVYCNINSTKVINMKKITIWLLILCASPLFAQTDSGDLEVYLNAILDNNPGDSGDDYVIPTSTDMTNWENCISALLVEDITTARTYADLVNYRIVEFTLTSTFMGRVVYILEEKSTRTKHWGTYVFNKSPFAINTAIQAPHSSHDFNTGKQAIYCYTRLEVRFLFLNGTHRCNHSQASTCSGATSVCSGSSQPFRISDLAHEVNSVWQRTTEMIYDAYSDSVFLQLHGFTKLPDDPYVILSNGSSQTPSGMDYASMIKDELFLQDNSLTFKIAHIDNWTRLVGFTNTQGRYINQSTDACSSSATSSTGRFVHIEQEKTKLRDDVSGWSKLHLALAEIFYHTVGVEDYIKLRFNTENPFQNSIDFSAEGVKEVSLYSLTGKELYRSKNTMNLTEFSIPTVALSSGVYILKVTSGKGAVAKKLIRE